MTTSNEGFSAAVLKKMKEEEDEKKRQAKAPQVLIEDGTMSAFGFSNTCEVEAKQK